MLKLHLFRDNLSNFYLYFYRLIVFFLLFKVGVFSLFSFPECESMQGMRDFSLDQPREDMSALMCIHSRAAEYLTADYQNHWNIPLPGSEDTTHRITLNDDILVQSLKNERGCIPE